MAVQSQTTRELSHQENLVLSLGSSGLLDKEIARELGVTIDTVRTYWRRIRTKMGHVTSPELASRFVKQCSETELSKLNLELEEHLALEKLLSVAFGIAPIGLMLFSASSDRTFVNPCWMQMFSAKYGTHVYESWGRLAHSDLEPFKQRLVQECITSGKVIETEVEASLDSGDSQRIYLMFRPITENGVVIGVICTAKEIPLSQDYTPLPLEAQVPKVQCKSSAA